jgi:hypothetical protein
VIQPHLPVRLPCYDFTPIADPTFDGSLLAVRPPASGVTNFRGVTGGVYKARERIHPDIADSGLLATPIRTETGFLGLAHLRRLATLCTGHCSMFAALDIRGMLT